MAKRRGFMGLALLVLIIAGVASAGYLLFKDMDNPEISLSPDYDRASPNLEFTATATDITSNIKSIQISVRKDNRVTPVAQVVFDAKAKTQSTKFKINVPELMDSSFELEVKAADDSMAGFGRGNTSTRVYTMRMDVTPPRLTLKNTPPYVRQGGAGCIIYGANKELGRNGVYVGNLFFPGFKQPNGDYVCFFAFPYNLAPKDYSPELFAADLIENVSRTRLSVYKLPQKFKTDTIKISDGFLEEKNAEFTQILPGVMTDLERFLKINGEVRAQNVAELLEIGKNTAKEMLWQGSFERLPRGATRAGFAEFRTYTYNNEKIDAQTHLGLDLASLAQSEIPAANNGVVLFAGYMGIYGNVVIIDHGMNLQTLYSHMSEIAVSDGDKITKGQIIGRTGSTGMAGGDHLHFAALMAGFEVSPLEWLDDHWIKDNVTDRILKAGGTVPGMAQVQQPSPQPGPNPQPQAGQ